MDIQIIQEAIIHRILPFVILAVKVIIHIVKWATIRFHQHPWGMEVICEGKLIFFNLEIFGYSIDFLNYMFFHVFATNMDNNRITLKERIRTP